MKFSFKKIKLLVLPLSLCLGSLCAAVHLPKAIPNPNPNQTPVLSPVLPSTDLPFQVQIEQAAFQLPNGIHSGVFATYRGLWLLLAGRTNGMHTFDNNNNNFPPQEQNQIVYVVDPVNQIVYSRALTGPGSGLTQRQIDSLSVTSPQFYQTEKTLYVTGGYGVNTATGIFSTKDVLTAIDIKGLINWVIFPLSTGTAAEHIRQTSHPVFKVTGGEMFQLGDNPTLLIFGQDFAGFYLPGSNGFYTKQVRRFYIIDDGVDLDVEVVQAKPKHGDPSFRRRDLNILPTVYEKHGQLHARYVAFSGVFTPLDGMWTIPVNISPRGSTSMKSPASEDSFKQAMNNYVCAAVGLFSKESAEMFNVFFGGISFGFFNSNGVFTTDSELPFINQITTVKISKHDKFEQFLMNSEYPVIPSTGSNPGNPLLFGAGALFVLPENAPKYSNNVLKFDEVSSGPTLIGYIVGGIMSTVPNTESASDSAASPYIFRVTLVP